ncbi:hypothetical protein L6164_032230 [Bauhinia variegata]|uniref:Uncharacterized protein n=1 Tax=Bauhinia variegata TaxID=167791 RepID=A0ACB9KMZ3_BAUVA|nr:hypothetical protein L6164_032230 [Bauhinia variegata]
MGLSMMALKGVFISGCAKAPQLGFANGLSGNYGLIKNLRYDLDKCCKWECCSFGVLAQKAITPVEDEKPTVREVEASAANDGVHENDPKGFHKDLNLLPSE